MIYHLTSELVNFNKILRSRPNEIRIPHSNIITLTTKDWSKFYGKLKKLLTDTGNEIGVVSYEEYNDYNSNDFVIKLNYKRSVL